MKKRPGLANIKKYFTRHSNRQRVRYPNSHIPITVQLTYCLTGLDSTKLFNLLKNGPNPASFCLFSFFSHDKFSTNLTVNDKSVDGVLGTRTQCGRMVGADKSTELWRHTTIQSAIDFNVGTQSY